MQLFGTSTCKTVNRMFGAVPIADQPCGQSPPEQSGQPKHSGQPKPPRAPGKDRLSGAGTGRVPNGGPTPIVDGGGVHKVQTKGRHELDRKSQSQAILQEIKVCAMNEKYFDPHQTCFRRKLERISNEYAQRICDEGVTEIPEGSYAPSPENIIVKKAMTGCIEITKSWCKHKATSSKIKTIATVELISAPENTTYPNKYV